MGLWQFVEEKQGLVIGVISAFLLVSLGLALWYRIGSDPQKGSQKAYYSIDDRATHFAADSSKPAPFDHEGKPAINRPHPKRRPS